MNIQAVKRLIRDVPDFPERGIVFKDITPLLADPAAFEHTIELLADRLAATEAEEILAIESRGICSTDFLRASPEPFEPPPRCR